MKRSKKHRKRHLLPGPAGILQQRNDNSSEMTTKPNEMLASQTHSLPNNDGRNKKSKSNLTHGQIWDAMCLSMDRIVPVGYSGRHISTNLAILRRAVPPDFSLLVEAANSVEFKIKKIIVQIEAVHSHGHYDYTVDLADESTRLLSSSILRQDASMIASASRIPIGWLSQSLIQMHPEWIKPGTVMLCHNVSLAVFRSSKGLMDRMILLGEDNVVYAWTEESLDTSFGDQGKVLDDDKYLRLMERRAEMEERLKIDSINHGLSDEESISSDSEDDEYDSTQGEVELVENVDPFHTDLRLKNKDAKIASHPSKLSSDSGTCVTGRIQQHEEMNKDQVLSLFADSASTIDECTLSASETQFSHKVNSTSQQMTSIQNPYHRSIPLVFESSERNHIPEGNIVSVESNIKISNPYLKPKNTTFTTSLQNREIKSQTDIVCTNLSNPFQSKEIQTSFSAPKNALENIFAPIVEPKDYHYQMSQNHRPTLIVTTTATTAIEGHEQSIRNTIPSHTVNASISQREEAFKQSSPRDVSSKWESIADEMDEQNAFDENLDVQEETGSDRFNTSPNLESRNIPAEDCKRVELIISDATNATHGSLFSEISKIADDEMDAFSEDV